jgi:hypothetical protein
MFYNINLLYAVFTSALWNMLRMWQEGTEDNAGLRRKACGYGFLTLEYGTDRLSRNVGKELSLHATQ